MASCAGIATSQVQNLSLASNTDESRENTGTVGRSFSPVPGYPQHWAAAAGEEDRKRRTVALPPDVSNIGTCRLPFVSVVDSGGSVPLADGHLPIAWCKEDLSVAYAHAIATAIGVTCDTPKRDINGWDAVFRACDTDQADAAQLAVQLECTAYAS